MVLSIASGYSPHPPVSVCGTGAYGLASGFSRRLDPAASVLFSLRVAPRGPAGADLPAPARSTLARALPTARPACPTASPLRSAAFGGTGISTSCPSPTAFALGLGPDSPWADEPSPGNLGFPAGRIPTCLSLLMPTFSLARRPAALAGGLLPARDAPLPRLPAPQASVMSFSPVHLRRGATRLVSCYALFECVAASKPTS